MQTMLDHAEKASSKAAAAPPPLLAELHGGALRLTPAGAWTVEHFAALHADVSGPDHLSYFVPVVLRWNDAGATLAEPRPTNTSGDFATLATTDGFIELKPRQNTRAAGTAGRIYRW
jgi:molybdopterin biosynthesis enzyme